ncbi:MAG: AbrB/MazE/SpoVT family DNA-binding domain-containing protein [Thermoguttaceae bacterium]|jgi:bifunctional DNA-binding transcriptional regulator/antitoxin component of YhaV-PrlF toxin-antitoxin module|nr:AbrB/MazE/SpoVT family DNA-binding domain-containing protein [Thermoguttaceae bacterium]
MDAVTVSPGYQVVVPKAVRERTGVGLGEKRQVLGFDDRIELVCIRPKRSMPRFLRGMDATFVREERARQDDPRV